jgi:hypothetical protein
METNQLITALKQRELIHSSIKSKLLPEEAKILELKYQSPVFGKMKPDELTYNAVHLLLKIHVITGWEVPQNEMMEILVDQFKKKITESYPMINCDEIEYAFRNKPTEIKEWGKAMNISLIDEVIQPYMATRFELSKFEEQKKQIEHKPDLAQIEKEYQDFLQTDLGKKLNPKI